MPHPHRLIAAAIAQALLGATAGANEIIVDSPAGSGPDIIRLDLPAPPATITLSSALPTVVESVQFIGPRAWTRSST